MLTMQQAHGATEKLHAIDVVEPPAYVTNLEYFEWPFPVAKYFAGGQDVALSMTQLDGEALPSWLRFTQEKNNVYTLRGVPDYNEVTDYDQVNSHYVLVAQDSRGAEVKLPFVLHIEGLSPVWLSLVMVDVIGLTVLFALSALGVAIAGKWRVRKRMLAGRYTEIEERLEKLPSLVRACCCLTGTQYKALKERVTLAEQEAVAMVVCHQATPEEIKKKTSVPVTRAKKWYKLYLPYIKTYGQSYDFEAILDYFKANERGKRSTTDGRVCV